MVLATAIVCGAGGWVQGGTLLSGAASPNGLRLSARSVAASQ